MLYERVRNRHLNFFQEFTHSSVNHVQNLGLDQFEVLGIPGWSTTDDVVNLDIVIFSAYAT